MRLEQCVISANFGSYLVFFVSLNLAPLAPWLGRISEPELDTS